MNQEAAEQVIDQEDIDETGQTGQECNKEGREFIELATQNDKWHWVLWSKNGRPIAMSARGYGKRNDAARAVELVRQAFADDVPILASAKV